MTYNYSRNSNGQLINNQLQSINDAVATSNYTLDLTNQTDPANYRYDAIGNLIYDTQSGITGNDGVNAITWSVYNKILSIYKTTGTISYTYNPAGQRVSKTAAGLTTWYIRDAQGNTLAVYNNAHSTTNWMEQHLYGSSRVGMWTPNVALSTGNAIATWDTIGKKQYELTNHLGNVLETLTDKRLQHSTNGTSIDYFNADAITAQDYYPFGMLQPGRQYAINTATYRYGFNGKENDNEVKGLGNEQDYGMRIYDPRVGRFLSVDPLAHKFPFYTPYQFAGNTPIGAIDLDGLESQISIVKNTYFVTLQNANFSFVLRKSNEYFTEATKDFTKNQHDFTINTQMFDYKSSFDYFWARTPQPATDYTPQGYNIAEGKIISGRSAKSTFYFSRSSDKGKWSIGYGDVPLSSNFGFGGGTPIIVNGLKFRTENIYKNDAPDRVRKVGATGWIDPADWKYLDQKSNGVYPGQNDSSTGKTVLGYNSKKNTWIIVSQQNGTNGFTLDEIRDNLFKKGYDYVLGFDGSSSSTLSQDGKTKISPDKRKDSTIPAGLNITVPNK